MSREAPAAKAPTTECKAPNILKCRDDPRPLFLLAVDEPGEAQFTLDSTTSWVKAGERFGTEKLRARIEPWLTALCQSEHLSLLVGSGLTHAVHRLATGEMCPGMKRADFGEFAPVIDPAADESAKASDRESANVEDQIRVANELRRGLEILGTTEGESTKRGKALQARLVEILDSLVSQVLAGERNLVRATDVARERAFDYLVSFLMSFASRSGTRDRLQIFTTSYDRYLEAGAEAAGLHLLDRFVGSLCPVFRSSRLDLDLHYNPPGIRGEPRYVEGVARFTKLHGSLDWVDHERVIRRMGVPFGAASLKPYLEGSEPRADSTRVMVFPNAAKDRETASYPYVDLFRDLAAAVCRPNQGLFTFGYSFGDEHINRVIEDMLTIPSTHLVVMSFNDPLGRIMKTYARVGRHAQMTLLVGDHVGEFQSLVDHYLPKPSIDRTTFRMAELLKARWSAGHGQESDNARTTGTEDDPS